MPVNKTALPDGKWWWGYLDDNDKITVKKYVGDWDIQKVEQLPFCKGIFEPFEANNKIHAHLIIMKFVNEEYNYHKKVN